MMYKFIYKLNIKKYISFNINHQFNIPKTIYISNIIHDSIIKHITNIKTINRPKILLLNESKLYCHFKYIHDLSDIIFLTKKEHNIIDTIINNIKIGKNICGNLCSAQFNFNKYISQFYIKHKFDSIIFASIDFACVIDQIFLSINKYSYFDINNIFAKSSINNL